MIGIDIFKIDRIKRKDNKFLSKVFTDRELSEAKVNFYQKLAGKWAAKEAVFKAGFKYANKEVEIITINNKPVAIHNNKNLNVILSISHEEEYAIAMAINLNET